MNERLNEWMTEYGLNERHSALKKKKAGEADAFDLELPNAILEAGWDFKVIQNTKREISSRLLITINIDNNND